MDISACLPDAAWCREVRLRVLTLWPLKALANSLGLALFFVAYFWVMRHPQAEVAVMPLTAVDGWFDFAPAAMPLYASLWLYLVTPVGARVARPLVEGLKVSTVAREERIWELVPAARTPFDDAVEEALRHRSGG